MAVNLVLHTINGRFVAFNIDFELYFMQSEPVPRIYDGDLKPQLISNLDSWFQAKTHQRYGFQSFNDIVAAFRAGLEKSYSTADLRVIVAQAAIATKFALLDRLPEYGKHFWVELLDPVLLETIYIAKVREKFDELREKLGDDGFHNYLCRLWKFATKHRPGLAVVFERFIKRLGREPIDPQLPETSNLDHELCKVVLTNVMSRDMMMYRDVPPHVQERLEILNGRR